VRDRAERRGDQALRRPREHVLPARQVGVGHIVVALNKADAADPEIADWPGPRLRGEISGGFFPSYPPKELPADPGTPTDALMGQSRRPADPRPEAGPTPGFRHRARAGPG
jgi:hypothetical protein